MDLIFDILSDAWMDSVKMLPFLFVAYWVIEYVEHRHSERIERVLAGGGRFGFVPAALLGCFPQCGFSAMAANLYGSKVITLGTLLAVFLTTSDEAIPLMIANPDQWEAMLAVIGVKIVVALTAAVCIDFVFKKWIPVSVRGGYTGSSREVDCHEHQEEDGILLAALKHTFNIFLFILAFNFVLGGLVALIGEDTIASVLAASDFWQPALAGLIGLIPNCVASVLLTQLFAAGQLSFGGMVAGLCTSAGVGLAVLCRSNKSWKQNAFIVALLYGIGTAAGILCQLAA
ncbi:putative manganese transporter [Ruthenibacterium sp. CLA-JM-H11]|uniref:Manganese transporter n=1 Tax=Ruthenibacterium intestinale TaxID=3133163 RepID=A0ABV1GB48_9FIRM